MQQAQAMLPESGAVGESTAKICLETKRAAYKAQHSTEQTTNRAPAFINLNKYQQWMASESNHLFF